MNKTRAAASSTHSPDAAIENGPRLSVEERAWRLKPLVRLVLLSLVLIVGAFCAVAMALFNSETAPRLRQVYLTDLNGNGHLDAFLFLLNENQRILLNDGDGRFTFDRELYITNPALAVGDITGDGQTDIIVNQIGSNDTLVCATMPSSFTSVPRTDGVVSNLLFATLDVSNGGGLDDFIVFCCKGASTSIRHLSNRRPCLAGEVWVRDMALADLNGNGRLDAFLVKGWGGPEQYLPNEVWFNDGQGDFSDSGQRLGDSGSLAVVLGDLNGNGFADAVVGNNGADEIWFNDGQGNFSDSGQRLGGSLTHTIFLADLNDDGHPDLFLAGNGGGQVWLNDGTGRFSQGQRIRYGRNEVVALGDVTGNGHPDLFVAGLRNYRVWQGGGNGRFTSHLQSNYR
jgi:hypothetical protein